MCTSGVSLPREYESIYEGHQVKVTGAKQSKILIPGMYNIDPAHNSGSVKDTCIMHVSWGFWL